ncbi:MAG: translation initiation factor IF-3 [Kiritimatiellae bacterium]|nr:translation initiation factor IF-3 [Kiritimatiellia bacterium]
MRYQRNAKRDFTRINHRIRVLQVRCVGVDGEPIGIVETRKALLLSQQAGLDLVEISPNAQPPVCRIMDYGKFKYDRDKKKKQAKKHQTIVKLKEIKFHANVEEHDYQTKVRHAREFLEEGHRVKFSLYFRGRENAHHDKGYDVMNRAMKYCEDIGNIEQVPKLMGRSLIMFITSRTPLKRGKV